MFKVAVVEDEDIYIKEIQEYFMQFEGETGNKFCITVYHDGDGLLNSYQGQFDIIFMDIQMKFVNGMSAAEQIRELDSEVIIIFITNMAQYAVKGYEVDAMDYILKPVTYFTFSQKLQKALNKIKKQPEIFITIPIKGGISKIGISSLLYVESHGHILNYYTQEGMISSRARLADVEEVLGRYGFFRINKGCIVNMKYVDTVLDGNCYMEGAALPVARNKKKAFMDKLTEYIGEAMK